MLRYTDDRLSQFSVCVWPWTRTELLHTLYMQRKIKVLTQYKCDLYINWRKRKYEQNFQESTNPIIPLRHVLCQLYDADQTSPEQTPSMLNKWPKLAFRIHKPNFNFVLVTYPNVRTATAKNHDKAGLPRLTNPRLANPTRKLVESTTPNFSLPTAVNRRTTTLGGKVTGKEHSWTNVSA